MNTNVSAYTGWVYQIRVEDWESWSIAIVAIVALAGVGFVIYRVRRKNIPPKLAR